MVSVYPSEFAGGVAAAWALGLGGVAGATRCHRLAPLAQPPHGDASAGPDPSLGVLGSCPPLSAVQLCIDRCDYRLQCVRLKAWKRQGKPVKPLVVIFSTPITVATHFSDVQ